MRWLDQVLHPNNLHTRFDVTWSAEEARAILSALTPDHIRGVGDRLFVYVDGRWRRVYRVDLFNQVATYRSGATLAQYIDAIAYGVRVDDDSIGIIDSTTDG